MVPDSMVGRLSGCLLFPGRPEQDEEADHHEPDVEEEPGYHHERPDDAGDTGGGVRCSEAAALPSEHGTQHPPSVHRHRREKVERAENQVEPRQARPPTSGKERGWPHPCPEEEPSRRKKRTQREASERSDDRDGELIARGLGHGGQLGHPPYRKQEDVDHVGPAPSGHQAVGYLVDNDTDEECGDPQESFRLYGSTGIPIGQEHETEPAWV